MTQQTTAMGRRKPYFHLIPDAEWERMKAEGWTWGRMARAFAAPAWCSYPGAVDPMGCWSLVGRMVTGRDYCKNCDFYKRTANRLREGHQQDSTK